MYLNNFILSGLEDVTGFFVFPHFFDLLTFHTFTLYGFPYGLTHSIFSYSEPLLLAILFILARYFNPILIYNIFVLVTFALTFLVSRKFFGKFIDNQNISSGLGILYTFSPYLIYHYQSHPQLSQIWLPIFFMSLLIWKPTKLSHSFYIGAALTLVFLTSNYLGFLTLILYSIYLGVSLCIDTFTDFRKGSGKNLIFWNVTRSTLLFGLSLVVFTALSSIWVYFYFSNSKINVLDATPVSRSISDFVVFTNKPWTYFIPPVDNPLFGGFGSQIITFLQDKWGYFWTQNYFKKELQSSYIGLANLVLIVVGIFALRKRYKLGIFTPTDKKVLLLGISTLIFILVTLPPFFTLNQYTFYLPSYFIWKYLPMFRVLARGAFLVNLVVYVYVAIGAEYLVLKYKNIGVMLVILLFTFSFMEHFIPFKVTTFGKPPEVYSYLQTNTPANSPVVIYPISETTSAFYWLQYHGHPLVNPAGFTSYKDSFDSTTFTKNLTTCEGLVKARDLGAKYVIVFRDSDGSKTFDSSPLLKRESHFSEISNSGPKEYFFLKITDVSAVPESFVYSILPNKTCQ